jgi:hypothetical protein
MSRTTCTTSRFANRGLNTLNAEERRSQRNAENKAELIQLCVPPRALRLCSVVLLASIAVRSAVAQNLTVLSVDPPARTLTAPRGSALRVTFDRPVDPASFVANRTFWAFGHWSGAAVGSSSFSAGDTVVTLTPDRAFSAGESVMVVLAESLRAADGTNLRSGGYTWQFWTATRRVAATLTQIGTISTRTTPDQTSRAYGGIATDLNRDGWLDLTIVNEDTDDLRVFLNRSDGSGLFQPFLTPTFGIGNVPSPSEATDFNHDGIADICVANTQGSAVSILLGLGDGRFGPAQTITVGTQPRGICVLDADGDGDMDIVNTNYVSSNLSLLLNDGSGVFGSPTFFEGGGSGERAITAVDMTEDGLLDLVVAAFGSARVIVHRGNGDGTFTNIGMQNSGGSTWMLNAADLNGDGHEDVALVNSGQNTGVTMLGNGAGQLAAPVSHPVDDFPLATDLGDLDGDGDLDWVASSYQGDWFLFRNDGAGNFTFWQEYLSPQAASCALLFDFDNDLDLDVGLIDELADVVLLMENRGVPECPGDVDADGDIDLSDLALLLSHFGDIDASPADGDTDIDGDVDLSDLALLLSGFGNPC